jgi:hypothetical protein
MPFVFEDLYKSTTTSLSITDHPILAAVLIGVLVCAVVVIIMRNDGVRSSKVKIFKIFTYSTLIAVSVIILQNTALMRRIQKNNQPVVDMQILRRDKTAVNNAVANTAYVPFTTTMADTNGGAEYYNEPVIKSAAKEINFLL